MSLAKAHLSTGKIEAELKEKNMDGPQGLPGGTRSIEPQLAGNVLFVDAVFGNDETAQPFNGNLPYASLRKALKTVRCLNLNRVLEIFIRPGTYNEGPLKLVDNVSVRGSGRLSTVVLGSIDTSEVQGRAATLLDFSLVSTEVPAIFGGSNGFVSFRMMRLESNYTSKRDDQSTVVISPIKPSTPQIPCIRSGMQCESAHVITDSELILNSTGGADIKVVSHLDGGLQLERNTKELNVDTLQQIDVTRSPFTATANNVEYILHQPTDFILPQISSATITNIQITQAAAGVSNVTSRTQILGSTSILIDQSLAISVSPMNSMNQNYISLLINDSAPVIPSNLRIYAIGGAQRSLTQTFRGLNNRSSISSNNQLFETSNLKLDNTPQTPLPIIQVTTSPFVAVQDNTQYIVTANDPSGRNTITLPSTGPQGPTFVPTLTNILITSQTSTATDVVSNAPIVGPPTVSNDQTLQVIGVLGAGPNAFNGYQTRFLSSAANIITAKQVGESYALNVPRVPILNTNRLLNTPGISGFELQAPSGGGQLVFRIGPPANDTFVALHLFVPQSVVGSIVQTTDNTRFIQNSQNPIPSDVFAINNSGTEGQFKQAGLYGIDDSLSLNFWTVRYLGFPNALTRVNESAPETPPQISVNTPTLETGNIETLVTSESRTASLHINQVAAFERKTIPAINHPEEARRLVSVQQVSTQYEHLRGGTQIESTPPQLAPGTTVDVFQANVRTFLLGGGNTLIIPAITLQSLPENGEVVLVGTIYQFTQGPGATQPSTFTLASMLFDVTFFTGNGFPLTFVLPPNKNATLTAFGGFMSAAGDIPMVFWSIQLTDVS